MPLTGIPTPSALECFTIAVYRHRVLRPSAAHLAAVVAGIPVASQHVRVASYASTAGFRRGCGRPPSGLMDQRAAKLARMAKKLGKYSPIW
jgi:hypothetical protein